MLQQLVSLGALEFRPEPLDAIVERLGPKLQSAKRYKLLKHPAECWLFGHS